MAFTAYSEAVNLSDKLTAIAAGAGESNRHRATPNLLRRSTHGLSALHSEIGATTRFGLPSQDAQRSHTDAKTGLLQVGE